MRTLLVLTLLVTILYSCKGEKSGENNTITSEVESKGDGYISIDSNIKLNDSITIDNFAYQLVENDTTKYINLKVVFSKESLPLMKTYKDLNLYIHLYPADSTKIKDLPKEHQSNGFDNWSVYDIHTQKDFNGNEFNYGVKTKIYQFSKVEMGLFDKVAIKRYGNPYVLNNVIFE